MDRRKAQLLQSQAAEERKDDSAAAGGEPSAQPASLVLSPGPAAVAAPSAARSAPSALDWSIALKAKEAALLPEDERQRRRREAVQQQQEADLEDDEDDDAAADGGEDDQSSGSSSGESDDDDEGEAEEEEEEEREEERAAAAAAATAAGGGGEEGAGGEDSELSAGAVPTGRRSSLPDSAFRISIIGELGSRTPQQPGSRPQHGSERRRGSAGSRASRDTAPPFHLPPAAAEHTDGSGSAAESAQPPALPSAASSSSSASSAESSYPLLTSATVSPPFPAPAVLPAAGSSSSSASSSSSPSPSLLPESSAAGRQSPLASGGSGSRCRVFHSVAALLRSRYDSNYDRPDAPVWISVENASAAVIARIGQHFDLHPLTIEDVQSRHTREKLEIFQHYLFLVFHSLQQTGQRKTRASRKARRQARKDRRRAARRQRQQQSEAEHEAEAEAEAAADSETMRTTAIKLIVFPHLVLSFTDGLRFPTLLAVRHRLRAVYENRLESTAWIIHAMLDCIVDALLPVVDGTVVEVDALEDLIYLLSGSEHRDLLKRMGLTRRRLSFLRQRLWSKRDILMSLIGKDWQLFLAGVQIPYLRDVYDHVVTMLHSQQQGAAQPACAARLPLSLQRPDPPPVPLLLLPAAVQSQLSASAVTALRCPHWLLLTLRCCASLRVALPAAAWPGSSCRCVQPAVRCCSLQLTAALC